MAISNVFVKEFIVEKSPESLKETYWLFRNLISSVRTNFGSLIDSVSFLCSTTNSIIGIVFQYERFISGLSQEDPTLYWHLLKSGVIRGQTSASTSNSSNTYNIANNSVNNCGKQEQRRDYNLTGNRPLITWFVRFYSGIIEHNFLIK